MSDDAYGATVAKRTLSRRLAELRACTGYTANHICDILNWGRGKLGRFEANQWKRPEMSDIRDLIRIYALDGDEREEIEELAIKARARPWWRDYGEIFDNDFPGYENDAVTISVFMPLLLPGLLQTQAYMEAILRTGPRSPVWRRKAMLTRQRRQEVLYRTDGTAPVFNAVITEASLLYRWGRHDERLEQIEHLVEIGKRPNVNLRLQRLDDGPPVSLMSMVDIFEFKPPEPPIVYVETDYSVEEVSKPDAVQGYLQSFDRACDAALEAGDTTVYLSQFAKRME